MVTPKHGGLFLLLYRNIPLGVLEIVGSLKLHYKMQFSL